MYQDITDYLIKKSKPNNDDINAIFKYKEYNLFNSKFDKKDISLIEINTLKNIQRLIGGNFTLIHRVQKDSVKTPDCEYRNKLLFKNKRYFEIKSPKRCMTSNSKKHKISRQFDEAKFQSKNIIISLLRNECNISNKVAIKQIRNCLSNKRYGWINIVIFLGKNNYIKVYKKKRP